MTKKEDIVLIGGGGHCKACIDVLETEGKYRISHIIDFQNKIGQKILGYLINGSDDDLQELVKENKNFLITIGHIESNKVRIKLFNKVKQMGGKFAVVVSPNAHVSRHTIIKEGTIVMHGAVINAAALIEENCIINNLALVEHDCTVSKHTHISTGASVNGNCVVGKSCFVGSGSIINQKVEIKDNITIGSGAVVIKDITISGVYVGSPAKKIK